MKIRKPVTPARIDANRRNASHSTGPRTERGKLAVRHNAITFGLYAKGLIVDRGDGRESMAEFRALQDGLIQDFQPVGPMEELLVSRIATCFWRLRRASRAENGAILLSGGNMRLNAILRRVDESNVQLSAPLYNREHLIRSSTSIEFFIDLLAFAAEHASKSGTILRSTYDLLMNCFRTEVAGFFRESRSDDITNPGESTVVAVENTESFLAWVNKKTDQIRSAKSIWEEREETTLQGELARASLPPDDDMKKILYYENRVYKELDSALRMLQKIRSQRNVERPGHINGL